MTWIRTIEPAAAHGPIARTYEDAVRRAGRVAGIVRGMSLEPQVLEASMGLYLRIMFGRQGLGRRRREMLAVVVSAINDCHY